MMNERKTMVVKIGSSTLVEAGELRRDFIASLAAQARDLRDAGWDLVVVSSGAIACGAPLLGFDKRPTDMPSLQACASVGQCVLSAVYDEEFRAVDMLTSLVLLVVAIVLELAVLSVIRARTRAKISGETM